MAYLHCQPSNGIKRMFVKPYYRYENVYSNCYYGIIIRVQKDLFVVLLFPGQTKLVIDLFFRISMKVFKKSVVSGYNPVLTADGIKNLHQFFVVITG